MTERINELKALIETLDAESPLRKSLEDALNAELKRQAEAEAAKASQEAESQFTDENEEEEESRGTSSSSDILDGITSKIDELLEDDEFIAASAGFLLGAVTIGAGALAVSALKK